ncbi:MAG: DMT family transporter [Acidimicrobiales bacterium]
MLIAFVAAVLAGASFATGGVLQQHAASTRPEGEALSFRLLVDLAHDRLWWLGIGFAFLSYVLESLALAYGPLVLVQPLIVSELLFALPISIRWQGMRMGRREWAGTALVTCGLALGLVAAAPGQGRSDAPLADWVVGLTGVVVLAVLAVALGRCGRGPVRSSLYAVAAALVLGVQAALLKATIARFEHGLVAALTDWHLWAMVAASIVGLLLVQSAYESGPLATSMPVVDSVDPAVAIVFGILLFHEPVRGGSWLIGIFAGAAFLLAGIIVLDTSPLIQCIQRLEGAQRAGSGTAEDETAPARQPGSAGPTDL